MLKNTTARFGSIAILIHWGMAILIICMLALGLYMVSLPNSFQKLKLYGWHKEWGITILMLAFIRIFWRFINQIPALMLPWWEKFAARAVHWAFYCLIFAMPITGWLISSAAGLKVSFFGWFLLPNLIAPSEPLLALFATIHKWLGFTFIALIVLHTLAALKHHFIDKDDILRRMFP